MAQNVNAVAETTKTNVKSTIRDTDIVVVKSLVPNVHYTCAKTLESFCWAEVGDTQEMTFAQLKIMKNLHNGYFANKWLYPMNEIALKKLGLSDVFSVRFDVKDDMKVLYGNDENAVREKISFVSEEDKPEVTEKIKEAVKKGKITNTKIIRLLEKELDVELLELV